MSKMFQTVATVFSLSLGLAVMTTPFFMNSAEAQKGYMNTDQD